MVTKLIVGFSFCMLSFELSSIYKNSDIIIKSKLRKLEAREEKKSSRTLVQESHKLQQFQPQNLSIFLWISSPGMWDFTYGFLSPIRSLVFSQILDSHIMIRPSVSRSSWTYYLYVPNHINMLLFSLLHEFQNPIFEFL